MLETFFEIHNQVLANLPPAPRFLHQQVDWDTSALGIVGGRGVGKTTLLLQHWRQRYDDIEQCLYLSADNVEVASRGLATIAHEYFKLGGKALIIDEVHTYPEWTRVVKNIHDTHRGR